MKVTRYWNRLPRKVVNAPFLKLFNVGLDGTLSKRFGVDVL